MTQLKDSLIEVQKLVGMQRKDAAKIKELHKKANATKDSRVKSKIAADIARINTRITGRVARIDKASAKAGL